MCAESLSFDHNNVEPLIATLAEMFVSEARPKEVAILASAEGSCEQLEYENVGHEVFSFGLLLAVPYHIYAQIEPEKQALESSILMKTTILMAPYKHDEIRRVSISPRLDAAAGWRDNANAWLTGRNLSNEGKLSGFAPCSRDGLVFRSAACIHLYEALKLQSVCFSPLPVMVAPGKGQAVRFAPDFLLLCAGATAFVQIVSESDDGHALPQTPGIATITISSSDCSDAQKAASTAKRIIDQLGVAPSTV